MLRDVWKKNRPEWPLGELPLKRGETPLLESMRRKVREAPDETAIGHYGKDLTYTELDDLTDRMATAMFVKAGGPLRRLAGPYSAPSSQRKTALASHCIKKYGNPAHKRSIH